MRRFLSGAFSALVGTAVFAVQADATTTIYRVHVGGTNSFSSENFNNPGRLSDGTTVGTADYYLILDDVAATLTLIVTNTSPVVPGVCNPVISEIYFNAPSQITGMALTSQSGSGGPAPAYSAVFDADTGSNPQPNGAGPFGGFSIGMDHPMGIQGSIANADADTLPGPPGSMVIGPAIFVFSLTGNLAGLTAANFGRAFSGTPPGNMPANAVGHFQGGGVGCSASAKISNPIEDCFLVVARGPGAGSFASPFSGHMFDLQIPDPHGQYGITLASPAVFQLRGHLPSSGGLRHRPAAIRTNNAVRVTSFNAQTLMWNPNFDAGDPEKSSVSVHVDVWSDGTYSYESYGTRDGMSLSVSAFTTDDGRQFLTFPFTVDGMSPP